MSRRRAIVIPSEQPLSLPDPPRSGASVLGLAFIGLGAAGLVIRLLTKKGGFLALFASCVAISVGFSLTATKAVKGRNSQVHYVQRIVTEELDKLDPIGRAQVLASVAGDEAQRYGVTRWWKR
jgi:hypothetical protein